MILGGEAKIPHASLPKKNQKTHQNVKQKQYSNKFVKCFNSDPHQKNDLKKREREKGGA